MSPRSLCSIIPPPRILDPLQTEMGFPVPYPLITSTGSLRYGTYEILLGKKYLILDELQYVFPIPRVCWRPEESSSWHFLPRARSRRSMPRKSPLNSSQDLGSGRLAQFCGGTVKGWHLSGICWSGVLHPSKPWLPGLSALPGG